MARAKTYLVPLDCSKSSEVALDHAIKLSRETKGKLLLLHVISESALNAPGHGTAAEMLIDYYRTLEEAQKDVKRLIQRKRLKPAEYRFLLIRRGDPARAIANQAKKYRASMIIMGSHGRTGLKRLLLGSVAERTLRYAGCPVLIVKR